MAPKTRSPSAPWRKTHKKALQPAAQQKKLRHAFDMYCTVCHTLLPAYWIRFSVQEPDLRLSEAYKISTFGFQWFSTCMVFWFWSGVIGTDVSRCSFFTSALGCKRGDACAFCEHVIETKLPNARPRKARRDAVKARIWGLLQQLDVEKQEPQETWQTEKVRRSFSVGKNMNERND